MNDALMTLSALSHEKRLGAFRLLVRAGGEGMKAGDLAQCLDNPASTNSSILSVLQSAGLVQGRREGRSIIYVADLERVQALITYLLSNCCGGKPEVCASVTESLACLFAKKEAHHGA